MPRFKISVPQVWRREVAVDGADFDDAVEAVLGFDASIEEGALSYSSTIGPEEAEWIVLDGPGADD